MASLSAPANPELARGQTERAPHMVPTGTMRRSPSFPLSPGHICGPSHMPLRTEPRARSWPRVRSERWAERARHQGAIVTGAPRSLPTRKSTPKLTANPIEQTVIARPVDS
jgi:hypothetical protein